MESLYGGFMEGLYKMNGLYEAFGVFDDVDPVQYINKVTRVSLFTSLYRCPSFKAIYLKFAHLRQRRESTKCPNDIRNIECVFGCLKCHS